MVIFALCCGLGYSDSFAFWEKNLTYEGESVYNYLQVSEDDTSVRLSTNVLFGVQSVYMKQDRLTGMYYGNLRTRHPAAEVHPLQHQGYPSDGANH